MIHHAWHLRLPTERVRHSLPRHPWVLSGRYDVSRWYLLGCGSVASAGFGGASLLRRAFSVSFIWDAIYAVNLEVHAFSPFLRVRYPGKREKKNPNSGLRDALGCNGHDAVYNMKAVGPMYSGSRLQNFQHCDGVRGTYLNNINDYTRRAHLHSRASVLTTRSTTTVGMTAFTTCGSNRITRAPSLSAVYI